MSANQDSALQELSTGTWTVDPSHSEVTFTVRHMMVSKVRGHFTSFEGEIEIADDRLNSTVRASVDMASIDTRDENRDNHLRSPDFFDVEKYPKMEFASTSIKPDGDNYILSGDLTIHGVARNIELELEFNGVTVHPQMGTKAGFTATGEISRNDFGIDLSMPLDGGGVVVGDKIKITLEIEANKAA